MADSVYKVIELVGTSGKSWEDAAQQAVASASKSLRNLRIAEVIQQDATIDAACGAVSRTSQAAAATSSTGVLTRDRSRGSNSIAGAVSGPRGRC